MIDNINNFDLTYTNPALRYQPGPRRFAGGFSALPVNQAADRRAAACAAPCRQVCFAPERRTLDHHPLIRSAGDRSHCLGSQKRNTAHPAAGRTAGWGRVHPDRLQFWA